MKSITKQTLAMGLLAFSFTAGLSACKTGTTATTFLNAMDLSVTQSNNQSYINLTATLNLGNVSLQGIQVNVQDPKTKQDVGTLSFSQLSNGQNQIALNVNASVIANADATLGSTLPNGNAVPLVLGTGNMLGIPVLSNSIIYLGGDLKQSIYAGVALGIPGLDQVMSDIGLPLNIFFSGNFGTNLLGVAGLYTSSTVAQNGIAVFGEYNANAASLMQNIDTNKDQQIDQLSPKTKHDLVDFFLGAPRQIKLQ